MKFYHAVKPDAQWRICLGGYAAPSSAYVMYTTDDDDCIHLDPYGGENLPKMAIHKVDDKGRIIIPKGFREDGIDKYFIAMSDTGIILKPVMSRA